MSALSRSSAASAASVLRANSSSSEPMSPPKSTLDGAAPVDQHAHLPLDLARDLAQVGAKLMCDHLRRRHTPAIDALEHTQLRWFEPGGMSADRLQVAPTVATSARLRNRGIASRR